MTLTTNLPSDTAAGQSKPPTLHGWTRAQWNEAINRIFPRHCRAARESLKSALSFAFSPGPSGKPTGIVFASDVAGASRAKVNAQTYHRGIQDSMRCGLVMPERRVLTAGRPICLGNEPVVYRPIRPGSLEQLHIAMFWDLRPAPSGKRRMSKITAGEIVTRSGRLYSGDLGIPPATRLALFLMAKGAPAGTGRCTGTTGEMYRQDVQAGACTFSSQETEPAQVAGATESLNYLELKTELFELGERANAQPSPHATILSPRRKRPTPTNDGVRTVLHEAGLPELPANVAAVNAAINAIANGGMKHVGTELGGGVGMDGEYMCVDHSWAVDEDTAVEVLHQLVIGAMVSGMTVNRFWFEDARWRKAPVMHHGR